MTKQYFQPEVQVTNINLSAQVLAGSPGDGSKMGIHNEISDDQW